MLGDLFRTQLRFLAFQPVRPDLQRQLLPWLIYIFAVTWLVGMGRYWDHLHARPWQTAGLGSLAYHILFPLTGLAMLALPVLLIGYLHQIYIARFDRRRS